MQPQLSTLIILLLLSLNAQAQLIVNAYTKITNITGTTLTLSNVNETFDSFEDGEQVIIYQVQDDVVTNTSNTSTAGEVDNINAAGLFEVVTILSHTEVAGVPTSITLSLPLSNSYNASATGSLQLITFPELGSPNYTTTNNISGLAWNGDIGGVVAFQVVNDLILDHSIDASNLGFRGGQRSRNFYNGRVNCPLYSSIFMSNSDEHGEKGEGIHKMPTGNTFSFARGNIASGGGGGNHINAGGGGGANQTAGGEGGRGWAATATGCPTTASCGGFGGGNLSPYISSRRLFLGGGGGGGQQNNNVGTPGGRGGGFILVRVRNIILNNCSGTIAIQANGETPIDARNDGAGGAGAGGSIFLDVNAVQTSTTGCQLALLTNGGNGGNARTSSVHGGGGGGGQGSIIVHANNALAIGTTSVAGLGGCSANNCNPSNNGLSGQDSSSIILLSVDLEVFDLTYNTIEKVASLDWAIAPSNEKVDFIVERSPDAINWTPLGQLESISNQQYYQYTDPNPLQGDSYYRIQYHTSSNQKYSPIKSLYIAPREQFAVLAPNPIRDNITLRTIDTPIDFIQIYNLSGALVTSQVATAFHNNQTVVTLNLERLPSGVYILNTNVGLFKINKI